MDRHVDPHGFLAKKKSEKLFFLNKFLKQKNLSFNDSNILNMILNYYFYGKTK